MPYPLLATKLFIPPSGKSLVVRPRLLDKLEQGLYPGCRLTLVCAPAGFGKTTLVSSWAGELASTNDTAKPSVAWFSLDDGDNDPILFWSYIIAALQSARREIGSKALAFLNSTSSPDLDHFLLLLINDLVQDPDPTILILDDYHLVRNREIHKSLASLIEKVPPALHVLLLSRTDPPLPLARLRGRGQLMEIRLADLRFSNQEALAYLHEEMKLTLPETEVESLNAKTEGWAAGLQMAAISMQGTQEPSRFIQNFGGTNSYILDYLTDEILDRQPADIQTFLLQTSVLQQFSASLCETVVGIPGSGKAMLEYLEKSNLFLIPLDPERRFYRYHHLFAEILQAKLTHSNPMLVPVLQKRAAEWSEKNGYLDEAVHYWHAAKEDEALAGWIEQNALAMIKRGQLMLLRKWVQLLPVSLVEQYPWLCILMAWYFAGRARLVQAGPWLDQAEAQVRKVGQNNETSEMLGTIYALRTEILHTHRDIPGTIEMANKALELLNPDNLISRASAQYSLGWAYFASGDLVKADRACSIFIDMPLQEVKYRWYSLIVGSRSSTLAIQGKLGEAISALRQAIEYMLANDIDRFNLSGNVYYSLAMSYLLRNALAEADTYAEEGLNKSRDWGNLNAICAALSARASLRIAKGDVDGAGRDLDEEQQLFQSYTPYSEVNSLYLACRLRHSLMTGDISAARHLIEENGLHCDDELIVWREEDHISLAQVCLAREKYAEADQLLSHLADAARAGGRFGRLIHILNLRAIALQALGKDPDALQVLDESLALGEPEGYVRFFVEQGDPMKELLRRTVRNGFHPEYARQLLAIMEDPSLKLSPKNNPQTPPTSLMAPLSEREINVLQLIAAGCTNKEIAHKLFISLRTVKYHTTSIFNKLNVNNRAHAAVRARELGLLK
jgi:LuxR family transcriptional regulator, maltose regulon positive regulatory protein